MNLSLFKIRVKEPLNSTYLMNLYSDKPNRVGLSYKSLLAKNNLNFNLQNFPQKFERKFQFRYLIRTFNNLINNKKRNTISVEDRKNYPKLYLPSIKEFNLSKSNNNINNNNIKNQDYQNNYNYLYNKDYNGYKNNINKLQNSYNISEIINKEKDVNYINKTNNKLSKSNNLERSNSSMSQTIINNKNNSKNEIEKKTLFKNLSHTSIFDVYKNNYLSSLKDYKSRNKLAEDNFKEQLEKIKKEKFPKSKNEELFKEYEVRFNPDKFTEDLKNEFHFFQEEDNNKKSLRKKLIDESNKLHIKKLFKDLRINEDKKNNSNYELLHNGLKPSQRIIQNMIRREKKLELYEASLINFDKQKNKK